jgi:hypothetical protein
MKKLYVKCLLITLATNSALAQTLVERLKKSDRIDLIANINKVHADHLNIRYTKHKIKESREANNKAGLHSHKKKLALQKAVLKNDFAKMKADEDAFVKNKNENIERLALAVKAGKRQYEMIRRRIKKDLSERKDWSLQKDARELLEAQESVRENELHLAEQKVELSTTMEATSKEWKKAKMNLRDTVLPYENRSSQKSLSRVQ